MNGRKGYSTIITPAMRLMVDTALEEMQSHWGVYDRKPTRTGKAFEGLASYQLPIPKDATMPFTEGNRLYLSTWSKVNDHFVSTLGEVAAALDTSCPKWSKRQVDSWRNATLLLAKAIERDNEYLKIAEEV